MKTISEIEGMIRAKRIDEAVDELECLLAERPDDVWRDPGSFAAFRRKSSCLAGRCAGCPHAEDCKAGCSAMAHSQTGTLAETTFCIRQLEQDRILQEMAL